MDKCGPVKMMEEGVVEVGAKEEGPK